MSRQNCSIYPAFLSLCGLALALSACAAPPPAPAKSGGPQITPASQSGDYKSPLDSVPDPNGQMIYFTAENGKGKGVFKVIATGGATAEVFVGAPFISPTGVGMSLDGKQMFVADPQANQIFAVAIADGSNSSPNVIAGTNGTAPLGMDVVSEGGQPMIYFSGKDPQDGQPAIFKILASGADKPMVVAKGAPLVEPDGIAVAPDGTVYVADRAAAGEGFGKVFKITNGKASALVEKVRTGSPAGIALTKDGSTLLVSALQPDGKSDQVLVVTTATGASSSVTDVVGQNSAAGGVHRAHNVNEFSWADITSPCGGARHGCAYRVLP